LSGNNSARTVHRLGLLVVIVISGCVTIIKPHSMMTDQHQYRNMYKRWTRERTHTYKYTFLSKKKIIWKKKWGVKEGNREKVNLVYWRWHIPSLDRSHNSADSDIFSDKNRSIGGWVPDGWFIISINHIKLHVHYSVQGVHSFVWRLNLQAILFTLVKTSRDKNSVSKMFVKKLAQKCLKLVEE